MLRKYMLSFKSAISLDKTNLSYCYKEKGAAYKMVYFLVDTSDQAVALAKIA